MAEIHLLHGWKAGPADIRRALEDMPPEAFERGLRLVFAGGGMQEAFVGEVLLTVSEKDAMAVTERPSLSDVQRLREALALLGMEVLSEEEPKLWMLRD